MYVILSIFSAEQLRAHTLPACLLLLGIVCQYVWSCPFLSLWRKRSLLAGASSLSARGGDASVTWFEPGQTLNLFLASYLFFFFLQRQHFKQGAWDFSIYGLEMKPISIT